MKYKVCYGIIIGLLTVSCTFSSNLFSKENVEATPEEPPVSETTILSSEDEQSLVESLLPSDETAIFQSVEKKYIAQAGTPLGMENFLYPQSACNWLGVAGQVFDVEGQPQIGYVVEVGGILEGENILLLGITGGKTSVGVGGYEITLSDHTFDSTQKLWVQLFDLQGKSLSSKVFFDTYNDCGKNLIIVNLTETYIAYLYDVFFPIIFKN